MATNTGKTPARRRRAIQSVTLDVELAPSRAFLAHIDWPLLREQKAWLLALAARSGGADREPANGLLALIDALQDYAHDECGVAGVFEAQAPAEAEDALPWLLSDARCPSVLSHMRCELPAGHERYHKHGTAGWEETGEAPDTRVAGDDEPLFPHAPAELVHPLTGLAHRRKPNGSYETLAEVKERMAAEEQAQDNDVAGDDEAGS